MQLPFEEEDSPPKRGLSSSSSQYLGGKGDRRQSGKPLNHTHQALKYVRFRLANLAVSTQRPKRQGLEERGSHRAPLTRGATGLQGLGYSFITPCE